MATAKGMESESAVSGVTSAMVMAMSVPIMPGPMGFEAPCHQPYAKAHECKLSNGAARQGSRDIAKNETNAKRQDQSAVGVDAKEHAAVTEGSP